MRYGTAKPHHLVERAAAWGQPALALTDRDGLYGAVKFVRACMEHGIAPILGVDLALEPPTRERARPGRPVRTPVRGGALVDPRLPRVTVLARGSGGPAGLAPGEGWAALCRLVTATHLRGERGNPVTTADLVATHAGTRSTRPRSHRPPARPRADPSATSGEASGQARPRDTCLQDGPSRLVVLLGPDSDVGRAVLARKHTQARTALERWVARMPRGSVVVEVVCHGGPEHLPGSLGQAGRMLALAREVGVPSVITAAVRHTDPQDAAVVDVLDAARRLVALDERHLDRVTDGRPPRTDTPHARPRPRRRAGLRTRPRRRWDPRQGAGPRAGRPHHDPRDGVHPGPPGRPRHRVGPPARARGARHPRGHQPAPRARPALPRVHRRPLPGPHRERARCRQRRDSRTSWASSRHSATRPTSSPSRRCATSSARWGCGSRPEARVRARSSTSCSASPGSTRCATACSWSASAPRCGPSCPTSTSTWSPPDAPRSTSGSSTTSAATGSRASR